MRVLVTGGTGFLGSHLVHGLLETGFEVVVLKRPSSSTWRLTGVREHILLYDTADMEKAFKNNRIDIVMHTACSYGRNNESICSIVETNLMFGLKVLECAVTFNTDTFFNTDTLLQKYLNTYSLSKKQFVEWLKQFSNQIQVINMKLEHMYGPKDDETKFIPWVISQLKKNSDVIPLTAGIQKRDFVYVSDVVSAYLTTLTKKSSLGSFSEFDVGSGTLVPVKDFILSLVAKYKLLHNENTTSPNFGVLPFREGEMMSVIVDLSGLKAFGWEPKVKLDEGIDKLLEAVVK